jgi:hypothetical protein
MRSKIKTSWFEITETEDKSGILRDEAHNYKAQKSGFMAASLKLPS